MKKSSCFYLFLFTCFFLSCDRNKATRTDTPTSGEATIAVDECLAPVVQEEINVFTGLNTLAHINPVFTSENQVFKLLTTDSIRLIIAARDITEEEIKLIKAFKRSPRSQKIATDGIALIINVTNTDSLISVSALQKIITGKIVDWRDISSDKHGESRPLKVVFDNSNSSTLRFIKDSICKGNPISNELTVAKSNLAVIKYVADNPNALGIIGVNWISNPNDSSQLSFDNTIRVMSVSQDENPNETNSYKPFPAFLATRQYPLTRDVYAIISDVRGGLPSGFVAFLAGDSGQRIVLKAGLVPATRPSRLINVKNEFESVED